MSIRAIKWAHEVLPFTDLPPTERCALLFLAYKHHDKTGECFPSVQTIADACGIGERRARQALKLLEAWRLISSRRGATPNGNASNRYTLFGKPKRPRQTGTKKPLQTGIRLPFSNRQTSADDRGNTYSEEKGPANLRVMNGGLAHV